MDMDRLIPTLVVACFVCFAAGAVVGVLSRSDREPRAEVVPVNYDPSSPQLKACYQLLTTEIMALKQQVATTCQKAPESVAH
jgi:hypothetical protein